MTVLHLHPEEQRAREAMCAVGRSLFERGYVHATAGNISVRLAHGLLMTPTDACLGRLDPARLAFIDAQGVWQSGDRPSKTSVLHQRIYAATQAFDPDTRCVLHTHSTHCVALSLRDRFVGTPLGDELLAPITPYFVMKVGHVPHIAYARPGAPESAQRVVDAIARYGAQGTPLRAVMLARLGPNVWHDSPEAAMAVLEELEETARLSLLSDPAPLSAAHLADLRQSFSARW